MSATEQPSESGPTTTAERLSVRLARALGVRDAGTALRHFTAYLPTQLVPALAGFLVLPILARRLTPTELGVLAIAQTLITLGWTATASWLATAIVRELPRHREHRTLAAFSQTFRRALGLSAVLLAAFAALLAGGGAFSAAIGDNLVLIVAATTGLVLQNIAVSILRASLRPRAYAVVDVLARTGGVGVGVALVFAGYGVQGYLLGLASASLAVGSTALAASWPRVPQSGVGQAAELGLWLRYGVPASLSAVATWGLAFIDRYLLALLENTAAVGVYSVGNVIGDKAVAIPAMAFLIGSGPLLITAYEQIGRAEVERLMRAYTRFVLLVGAGAAGLVTAVATLLVPLLAGPREAYLPASGVVPFVALGALLYALALIGYTGLVVARRTWPMVYAALIAVAVSIVANVILIPPLGIVGAAIATPIGTGAFLLACQIWSRSYASWRFPWTTLLRSGVAAAAAYRTAWLAIPYVSGAATQLVLAVIVFTAVYAGLLLLLGERRFGMAEAS